MWKHIMETKLELLRITKRKEGSFSVIFTCLKKGFSKGVCRGRTEKNSFLTRNILKNSPLKKLPLKARKCH